MSRSFVVGKRNKRVVLGGACAARNDAANKLEMAKTNSVRNRERVIMEK